MHYLKLEYYVSQARLNRFLRACGGSKVKAQKLYKVNLQVAQAYYPLLNLFEIFLRNALNNHISHYYNDVNWLKAQEGGFMSDPSLARSRFYLRECVRASINKLTSKKITVTPGRIVSEQTFGFWTALFDNHHYKLMGGAPLLAFPNKPTHIGRSQISAKLSEIRELRNRIYHNEPICFTGAVIDFAPALQVVGDIHEVIRWIDPELLDYTEYFNNIDEKIALANDL